MIIKIISINGPTICFPSPSIATPPLLRNVHRDIDRIPVHFPEMTMCLVVGSEISLSISEYVMSWMSRLIC